jgi:hypothetical protein
MRNLNKYFIIDGNKRDGYGLSFVVGCQTFVIDMGPVKRSKQEALWFKKQFKSALSNLIFNET